MGKKLHNLRVLIWGEAAETALERRVISLVYIAVPMETKDELLL